jgi:hypothetical protein
MFNFLWSGSGATEHVHLCKWEDLAKPKAFGGWGVKNLFVFSRALATNTLWRCLMKDGLWHRVLKDKYLISPSVVAWLRRSTVSSHKVSNTWRSLLKSLHVVTQWIAWKPGSGLSIRLGVDTILGLGKESLLSPGLISSLKRRGYHFLYQMAGLGRQGVVLAHWKSIWSWDWLAQRQLEWVVTAELWIMQVFL